MGVLLSRAPPTIEGQRGQAPQIFSPEHPQYLDHNNLSGRNIEVAATEFKNMSYKYYLAIVLTCLQVSGDFKKIGRSIMVSSECLR